MRRPVVGIIGNMTLLNETYAVHAGGTMNSQAVAEVAGCLPLIIPSDPRFVSVQELLDLCDGFLLTGGRPNVHPEEYGEEATAGAWLLRPVARCDDAAPDPRLRGARPAVPGHLPGLSGSERGHGRHALPRNPRSAGPDEPPDAARWHAGRKVRPAPSGAVHAGRGVSPPDGGGRGDDQFAARTGDQDARVRAS